MSDNVIQFPKKRRFNLGETPPQIIVQAGDVQRSAEIEVGEHLTALMQSALLPRGPLTHASLLGLLHLATQGVLLDLFARSKPTTPPGGSHA